MPLVINDNSGIVYSAYDSDSYSEGDEFSISWITSTWRCKLDSIVDLPDLNNTELAFQINDVGQANWNEIRERGKVKIIYDCGATIYSSRDELRSYIEEYYPQEISTHPLLIFFIRI